MIEQNRLLDEKATAELLGIKAPTLTCWRSTGRYQLPFVKVGRRVFYRLGDVQQWLDSRTRITA